MLYGSHPHNNTAEERMIVFMFVRDFLRINKLSCTLFSLAKPVSLPSYQLSLLPSLRSFGLGRRALRLSLRTPLVLPGILTFAVEGPPGSLPGQVLLRKGERIPPKEFCELYLQCACVPSPGGDHHWNLARSLQSNCCGADSC